jgi:hypothetical protein
VPETTEDLTAYVPLVPFLNAGLAGLERADWKPGQDVEALVAPIVVAVLVEVANRIPVAEMAALVATKTEEG